MLTYFKASFVCTIHMSEGLRVMKKSRKVNLILIFKYIFVSYFKCIASFRTLGSLRIKSSEN